ncbi:MAG: HDOD domain-containing protein [Pseudomonadota bacterium]
MSEYFIARQPIFDKNLAVYAYELLFRDSDRNAAPQDMDEDSATAQVLTTSSDVGLRWLVGDRQAFINLPQRFFEEPDLLPLPPDQLVLEILETVEINETTLSGIATFRERGFCLALDDVVDFAPYEATLPHVEIIKLEIPLIDPEKWDATVSDLKARGFKVLAEKVETNEEFEALAAAGCDYFQGYFFAKPKVVSGKKLGSNKIALLELLAKINDPSIDIDTLSELVSRDVALSIRVLNYVNSAANALNRRVESIREGVVYLGRDTIRNLVTVFTMGTVEDRPTELMTMALLRARFCELVALEQDRDDSAAYFTVGMFSVLDALMNASIEDVVGTLAVGPEMRAALVSRGGEKGEVLNIAINLERGEFNVLMDAQLSAEQLASLHQQAREWADGIVADSGLG